MSFAALASALQDGVGPSNIFTMDITGQGIHRSRTGEKKGVLSPSKFPDIDPRADTFKPKSKQKGKGMQMNIKQFTAMNAEGQGMDQVFVMQHDDAPEVPIQVTLKGEAHDGRDIFVLFTCGSLTGTEVVMHVMENHLNPFIERARRDSGSGVLGPGEHEPCVLYVDGDSANLTTVGKLADYYDDCNIRVCVLCASQTHRQQMEDVSDGYRDEKRLVNDPDAWDYADDNQDKVGRVLAEISEQSKLKFGSRDITDIATFLTRSQHSLCKSQNVQSRAKSARRTGLWPFSVDQIFMQHPGMSVLDNDTIERCKKAALGPLKELYKKNGFLLETDYDKEGIPETEEQQLMRYIALLPSAPPRPLPTHPPTHTRHPRRATANGALLHSYAPVVNLGLWAGRSRINIGTSAAGGQRG